MKKNKILEAASKLIIISAIIHLLILTIYAIINLDITYLNYFNIIDLNLFFPDIIQGFLSQTLSLIIVILLFFLIYKFYTKN